MIIKDSRNSSENKQEENYYKPVRVSDFLSNLYIEYKSNSATKKTLSIEE